MRSFNLIFSRHQNQKHSVIFHVSTFSVKIFVTVNLKVSSFCPSALVWTCFGSEAWNWIRIFIWTHHHWNLIPSRQLSYFILFYFILFYFILFHIILFHFILFYFILFYFILFHFILFSSVCQFGANSFKVSLHLQHHVTLQVLGSLWY